MTLRIDNSVKSGVLRAVVGMAFFVLFAGALVSTPCLARADSAAWTTFGDVEYGGSAGASVTHMLGTGLVGRHEVDLFLTQSRTGVGHSNTAAVAGNTRVRVSLQVQPMFSMKVGEIARISTPSGAVYDVVHERIEDGYGGGKVWVGYLAKFGKSYPVFISVYQGKVSGTLSTPQGQLRLQGDVNDSELIDRRAANEPVFIPSESDIANPSNSFSPDDGPNENIDAAKGYWSVEASAAATASNPAQIDVLYLYTPGFSKVLGGESGAIARINMLVATSNTVYANSGIYVSLHVAGASIYNLYPDSDVSSPEQALDNIAGYPVGPYDTTESLAITPLFNAVGADIVQMLRVFMPSATQRVCGVGVLWGAYSVVDDIGSDGSPACDGGYTGAGDSAPTHEIGHNMGATHDLYTSYKNAIGQGDPNGKPAYNRGYCNGFAGSVMAYPSISAGCSPIVPYFSNPALHTQCGGGECGVPIGTGYTAYGSAYTATGADSTTAINANATAMAGWRNAPAKTTYMVGVSTGLSGAVLNGSVSPAVPIAVPEGDMANFTISPNAGYSAQITGCAGTLAGTKYTIGPLNGSCTLNVSFTANTYSVTVVADSNGAVALADSGFQLSAIPYGTILHFTVMPHLGYYLASVSGCGGSLSGTTYTTAPITGACAVAATFLPTTYAVSTSVSANGTLTLTDTGVNLASVPYGTTLHFDVAPKSGYGVIITGCGGILSANSYVTAPITANCFVTAQFTDSSVPLPINLNQRGLGGTWYNPQTAGQGMLVDIRPDEAGPGKGGFFAGWYTYDIAPAGGEEKQRWYAVQGGVDAGAANASLGIYTGFGGNFNSIPKVGAQKVGTAMLAFNDCYNGTFNYHFDDGRSGSMPLVRLGNLVTCTPTGDNSDPGINALSGTYYDPATSGQGIVFDLIPSQNLLFAGWYTFAKNGSVGDASASQRWYTLQTTVPTGLKANQSFTSTIYTATGGVFDNIPKATGAPVGTATLRFSDCSHVSVAYSFNVGGNSGLNGSVNLQRLGNVPAGCAL